MGEELSIHLPLLEQVQPKLLSVAQEAGALLRLPHISTPTLTHLSRA